MAQPPMTDEEWLHYWRGLALVSVRNVTREQLDEIVRLCHESRLAQESQGLAGIGVWHAASIVLGTLDKCPCYPCTQARGGKVRVH